MNSIAAVEKRIRELMNDESRQIEKGIDDVVEKIQNTMSNISKVSQLPLELLSIMNMWARTEWYHADRVAKFEHCLHTIVAWELRDRVFNQLMKEYHDQGSHMVVYNDLRWVVNRVSSALSSSDGDRRYWPTMEIDLLAEAKHWVSTHGEHVTAGDGGHFQWYDSIEEVVCYHLPHIPQPPRQFEKVVKSLETLPSDFQHEADWTCSICLEVDAPVPTCVRTECKHIFHKSCLEDCKRVFLQQEENENKTCCPCPLCRAVIN